jgi:hypothetical protein
MLPTLRLSVPSKGNCESISNEPVRRPATHHEYSDQPLEIMKAKGFAGKCEKYKIVVDSV